MSTLARAAAIFLEILVLSSIALTLLAALRITVFDLGLKPKYGRAITMVMVLIAVIAISFFSVHLTLFYPGKSGG